MASDWSKHPVLGTATIMEDRMRIARFAVTALFTLALLSPHLLAQEKPAPDGKNPPAVLKLQVTITEQEGEKKLANLPYTFYLRAGDQGAASPWTKVRMGSRVPVYVGKDGGMQYIDVGTNIDARGLAAGEGRFDVSLNLERSWVEGDVMVSAQHSSAAATDANPPQYKEPIIRQFKTELNLTLHDAQTIQSTQATDPLSGRVLTVAVTMNVVK
jgi:hypothetical protein